MDISCELLEFGIPKPFEMGENWGNHYDGHVIGQNLGDRERNSLVGITAVRMGARARER